MGILCPKVGWYFARRKTGKPKTVYWKSRQRLKQKAMKRFIFIFLMVITVNTVAFAQQNGTSSDLPESGFLFGVHGSLPIASFKEGYNFGAGGYVEYDRGIARNLSAYLQGGYAYFLGKRLDDGGGGSYKNPNAGAITGIVGLKYIFSDRFDIGFGIGYGHFSASQKYDNGDGSVDTYHYGSGGLAIEPFVSYYFTSKTIFNLSLRSFSLKDDSDHSSTTDISFLSLGVVFRL